MMRANFKHLFTALFLSLSAALAADDGGWREFVGSGRIALLESAKTAAATFYVSPEGNDSWSGRAADPSADNADGPFRTLEKARDAVRAFRAGAEFAGVPTVIELRPGTYYRNAPLELTSADSGTPDSPIVWRGAVDEKNRPLSVIHGGRPIGGGAPVEPDGASGRIPPGVREEILAYDLKARGITDYGALDGTDNAELYWGDAPLVIARYPNEGFITFSGVDAEGNQEKIDQGNVGYRVPKLIVDDVDMTPWTAEPDLWAFGYWFWDWASGRQKVARIDLEKKILELDEPYNPFAYRPGKEFYVYHALCELDSPGEYYIDRESGRLYLYPPETPAGGGLYISTAESLLTGEELDHVVLTGLAFEGCRKDAVRLSGDEITIAGALFRGIGGTAVSLTGDRLFLYGNLLYNIGACGAVVSSGDQPSLRPGGSAIVNNDFHHFGRIQRVYAPAVGLSGCGDLIAQNRMTDAPHAAILFGGNEQRIERNEIRDVCEGSNDVGAIYTGGNWTMRGNIIRQNYLHALRGYKNQWCVGVYLDDMFSSADILENVFRDVKIPIMIGGGRDNTVANNLFVDCRWAIDLDARALGWAHRAADAWLAENAEKGTISGVDYKSPLWAERYPRLAAMMEATPKAPEGNLIERNVVIRTGETRIDPIPFEGDRIRDEARPYITVRNNVKGDARLLDEIADNRQTPLPATDGAVFRRIPTEKIGVFPSARAISRDTFSDPAAP
ncbi:MAG: right-handed parallel beta-helix repeat-containing protein [Thermoguttaceae bacterium]|nr:right-handed parallel beta-helix repeat-containing protein [Thermoguttaceae bacterium]